MTFDEVFNNFCIRSVTKKEYLDFLDPIIKNISVLRVHKGSKLMVFYYNIIEDNVVACRIYEEGEDDVFYLT